MSRIKDLLAEEKGIEDLIPTKTLSEIIFERCKGEDTKEYVAANANYEWYEEEIDQWELGIENILDLYGQVAQDALDDYIEEQCLDISDATYFGVIDWVRDNLANYYADYEFELCQEAKHDHTDYDKFIERIGQ